MQVDPAHYRLRFLLDIFSLLWLPTLLLSTLLHFFSISLRTTVVVPLYILLILSCTTVKVLYTDYVQFKEARALGAERIPRVVGRWPGNVDVLLRMVRAFKDSYVLDVYRGLFEEYGCTTLNLRVLWRDNIISMDQEHSKFVLSTGTHHFWRGYAQKERMELFLGQGIFNRDDDVWRMHRTTARPFFARERISDFATFETHWLQTLSILTSHSSPTQAHQPTPLDAQDLYGRYTLDTGSVFLLGSTLCTLTLTLPSSASAALGPKGSLSTDAWGSFSRAFEAAQINVTERGRWGAIWPLWEMWRDGNEGHCRVIRAWLDPLVREALGEKGEERGGGRGEVRDKNFLQHLADSTDDAVLIRDQLLSMLLASRDTTACTLTFLTYFMALHPAVTLKLRTEVLEHCGASGAPTFEKIRLMKYMRAVINETLRLFPPVPLNVRETRDAPCVLPPSDPTYAPHKYNKSSPSPTGFYMPARTTILYAPLLTARNPALWGDDADVFDPERWMDPERAARVAANPAMFAPFSAGPRICIGQDYAYNEISYFLVRLLQTFDRFTLAPEVQPAGSLPPDVWKSRKGRQAVEQVWPGAALTLFVKGGLWVRFHKATM